MRRDTPKRRETLGHTPPDSLIYGYKTAGEFTFTGTPINLQPIPEKPPLIRLQGGWKMAEGVFRIKREGE